MSTPVITPERVITPYDPPAQAVRNIYWLTSWAAALRVYRLFGVRLIVDWGEDSACIEVSDRHCGFVRERVLCFASEIGYEPMSEDECPSEDTPDGWHRVWLAKTLGY